MCVCVCVPSKYKVVCVQHFLFIEMYTSITCSLVHVLFIGEDWYMYCIYERIGTCTVYMRGLVHVLYI